MLRLIAALALLPIAFPAFAGPPVEGLWLTQDRDGIVAVEPCGTNLCARIEGLILDHADDPTPVDHRGVSQCHLPLIADARQTEPNLWKGHMTDPRNGSVYRVELYMDNGGSLALRGYVGIPLLGQTQTWTRYDGVVPADCRMAKSANGNLVNRPDGGPAG
jgi:uncharacterized protein (DUF2147 family)